MLQPSLPRFLRRRAILARYSISNSTLYAWMAAGTFPRPVLLAGRTVAWPLEGLMSWEATRTGASGISYPALSEPGLRGKGRA
jgi:prophage regulatory protein